MTCLTGEVLPASISGTAVTGTAINASGIGYMPTGLYVDDNALVRVTANDGTFILTGTQDSTGTGPGSVSLVAGIFSGCKDKYSSEKISFFRGDTPAVVVVTSSEDGTPASLEFSTLTLTVRTPTTILFAKSVVADAPASAGIATFHILPTDTEDEVVTQYEYDIEVRTGATVRTVARGLVLLLQDITF